MPAAERFVMPSVPSDDDLGRTHYFEEPLRPVPNSRLSAERQQRENVALAEALRQWSGSDDREDLTPLSRFLASYPRSRWAVSLLTDMGILAYRNGYFPTALEYWHEAWRKGKSSKDPRIQALTDRAVAEYAYLAAKLEKTAELESILREVGKRDVRGSASVKLAAAREGVQVMRSDPGRAFMCGPYALRRLLHSQGSDRAFDSRIDALQSTPRGLPLTRVAQLADELGMDLRMARRTTAADVPVPAVVHWKAGHFAAVVASKRDSRGRQRYHVQDSTFSDDFWLSEAALRSEASGYYLIPRTSVGEGWADVSLQQGDRIWGRGFTTDSDPDCTGACCNPVGGGSGSGGSGGGSSGGGGSGGGGSGGGGPRRGCPSCGMPSYSFNAMLAGLNIVDTPLFYTPPIGPPIRFTLAYSQKEIAQPQLPLYSHFGAKWTFSYLSYIEITTPGAGGSAAHYLRGGGIERYTDFELDDPNNPAGPGKYWRQIRTRTLLERRADGSYQRTLRDGSQEVFALSSGGTPEKIFLTEIRDPQGNAVTLGYDSVYPLRLNTISDAVFPNPQVTTLVYGDSNDPYRITSLIDPWSVAVIFGYDEPGNLCSSNPLGQLCCCVACPEPELVARRMAS